MPASLPARRSRVAATAATTTMTALVLIALAASAAGTTPAASLVGNDTFTISLLPSGNATVRDPTPTATFNASDDSPLPFEPVPFENMTATATLANTSDTTPPVSENATATLVPEPLATTPTDTIANVSYTATITPSAATSLPSATATATATRNFTPATEAPPTPAPTAADSTLHVKVHRGPSCNDAVHGVYYIRLPAAEGRCTRVALEGNQAVHIVVAECSQGNKTAGEPATIRLAGCAEEEAGEFVSVKPDEAKGCLAYSADLALSVVGVCRADTEVFKVVLQQPWTAGRDAFAGLFRTAVADAMGSAEVGVTPGQVAVVRATEVNTTTPAPAADATPAPAAATTPAPATPAPASEATVPVPTELHVWFRALQVLDAAAAAENLEASLASPASYINVLFRSTGVLEDRLADPSTLAVTDEGPKVTRIAEEEEVLPKWTIAVVGLLGLAVLLMGAGLVFLCLPTEEEVAERKVCVRVCVCVCVCVCFCGVLQVNFKKIIK